MSHSRKLSPQIWWDALCGIPRLNANQWNTLDLFGRWLVAIRAAVLLMTVFATCISGIFAYQNGKFDLLRFFLVMIGLVSAHATNNILNDLSDHKRGVDKDNAFRTQYGTQPVEEGFLTINQSKILAGLTVIPMIISASLLIFEVGFILIPFSLIGVILVFAYNWPLKHFGLGEPTVILVWGPLMVGGGYLSITMEWSWEVAWASLPYAIGATIVLFGKHIDKIPWDKPRGIRTLPVLLGHKVARLSVIWLILIQFGITFVLIYQGILSLFGFVILGSIPFAYKTIEIYLHSTPEKPPENYPMGVWPLWYSAHAFVHCRNFGALYLLSLLLYDGL